MIIKGTHEQQFEIRILGYQYPDATEYFDAIWLNVYFEYKSTDESWHYTDPSFMIGDVEAIVNWFNKLADNCKPEYNSMRFLDTNLYIKRFTQFDSPINKFRIVQGKFSMDFEYDNQGLKLLASELADELSKFPWRGIDAFE